MPLVCPHCGAYALSNPDHRLDATRCAACDTLTRANILPFWMLPRATPCEPYERLRSGCATYTTLRGREESGAW